MLLTCRNNVQRVLTIGCQRLRQRPIKSVVQLIGNCAGVWGVFLANPALAQEGVPDSVAQAMTEFFHHPVFGSDWTVSDAALLLAAAMLFGMVLAVTRVILQLKRRSAIIERQAAELEFQRVALNHHAIVSLIDADGIFEYVNDNFLNVTGYERSEVIGKSGYLIWPEEHARADYGELLETIKRGEVWSGEIPAYKKDRSVFWAQSTVVPFMDKNGKLIRSATVRTDITKNKTAEAQRQISNSFDVLGDVVAMFRPDTLEFMYLNHAALDQLGWREDEVHGKTFHDVTSAFDPERFKTKVQEAKNAPNHQVDFEIGTDVDRTSNVTLNYLTPKEQEPRVIAVIRDVTDQVRRRNEIGDLRAALDLADFEVFIMEPDTLKYTYLNKSALRAVGWEGEDYTKRTPLDDDDTFDEDKFRGRIAPLLSGELDVVKFERKSLHGRPTEVSIQYLELRKQGKRFVVVVRDISERKESERQIQRLKLALDLSTDSIHMFWPDTHKFFYGNELARKRVGATLEEFLDMTPMHTNPSLTAEVLDKRLAEIQSSSARAIVYESIATTETGELAPVEVNLQYIDSGTNRPYFLANIRDLTAAKKAERAKAEFVSTVSHELRTPLTSIKGSLGLVKAGALGPLTEKQTSMIEIAYSNCERLVLLINDILDLEKLEAGKMEYRMQQADALPLIAENIETMRSFAEPFGVKLEIQSLLGEAVIKIDPNRLIQVLSNLTSNAIKFSDPDETVRVTAAKNGEKLRITVSDDGSGIPLEAQDTIFEKFTQADSSDVRRTGGTGLGLSITRTMVENMDGEINFISVPGKGTEFWVEFPLLSSMPLNEETSEKPMQHILVCEDDLDYAKVIQGQLEENGFKVTLSKTAHETRELMKAQNFDVLTLDLGLPDADGMDLLRQMETAKDGMALPVVVITGKSLTSEEQAPKNLAGLFKKPPNQEELIHLIRSLGDGASNELPVILHVEDDSSTRNVLREIIGDLAKVVFVSTLSGAKVALASRHFDLVLLDIGLPDGNGLDVLKSLNEAFNPKVPIIVFSADEPSDYDETAISSVLMKSQKSNDEILEEIKSVLLRKRSSGKTNAKVGTNSSRRR